MLIVINYTVTNAGTRPDQHGQYANQLQAEDGSKIDVKTGQQLTVGTTATLTINN